MSVSPIRFKSLSKNITLSRFLKEHIYIPLGGNKKGRNLSIINILFTMLLGGIWHGASWNFVLWGGLHGIYLIFNNFSIINNSIVIIIPFRIIFTY